MRLATLIELTLSSLVIGSLAFAFAPDSTLPRDYNSIYEFVSEYRIVGWLLVIFATFAAVRIVAQFIPKAPLLAIRTATNFSLAVGYLFFTVLSVVTFGPLQVNWLNTLAISVISGLLYLYCKARVPDGG